MAVTNVLTFRVIRAVMEPSDQAPLTLWPAPIDWIVAHLEASGLPASRVEVGDVLAAAREAGLAEEHGGWWAPRSEG